MKRMHVHVAVDDLAANIKFYSELFGMQPAVEKPDYAKWMLDDPRVNFAISSRGLNLGVDHLGIQVDQPEELDALRAQLDAAGHTLLTQAGTTCCYAQSNKHWVTDPQGIAWETYHTLGESPTFGAANPATPANDAGACCTPTPATIQFVRKREPSEVAK
jgi:catechol 2,3-dioxygenase-like lactoylglutathione lyase family enzyme